MAITYNELTHKYRYYIKDLTKLEIAWLCRMEGVQDHRFELEDVESLEVAMTSHIDNSEDDMQRTLACYYIAGFNEHALNMATLRTNSYNSEKNKFRMHIGIEASFALDALPPFEGYPKNFGLTEAESAMAIMHTVHSRNFKGWSAADRESPIRHVAVSAYRMFGFDESALSHTDEDIRLEALVRLNKRPSPDEESEKINRFFKTYDRSIEIAKENRVSQSLFHCVKCNFKANADYNAALNILAAGHAVLACGVDAAAATCTRKGQAPCLRQFLTSKNLLPFNNARNPRPLGRGGCQGVYYQRYSIIVF